MKSKYFSLGILTLVIIGTFFISGCIQQEPAKVALPPEKSVKVPEEKVPEDDYPMDPVYRAKLEVTKINLYKKGKQVDVIFEYKNNKPYNLYWVTPFATIRRADGVIIKTYDSVWGDIAADILEPGEKCYAWVPFEEDAEVVAYAEAEVKGEAIRGWEADIKELKIEVTSHKGTYDEATGKYTVSGIVKNNGEKEEVINIYAGIFATNGTLLDVQEAYKIHIPAGESAMFTTRSALWTTGGATPDANKISTYELCITRY